MKNTPKKSQTTEELSLSELLENNNSFVLKYIDQITNDAKRIILIKDIVTYLNDCLLDRDFGNNGQKLIDLLNEKLQPSETNIKDTPIEDLIWWKGTEGQLIFLYEELIKNNLIDSSQEERKYVLLSKHFKNKKGEMFTNKQMSQAAQNLSSNKNRMPKKADLINETISKIQDLE